MTTNHTGITVELPGRQPLRLSHLLLDFNGTLAVDGQLIQGVYERLRIISQILDTEVLTADTFGTANACLADLPIKITKVGTGPEKAARLRAIGAQHTVVIGNGRNDLEMARGSALSICIIGPEGTFAGLTEAADVIVGDIHTVFDLLNHPQRLCATLRD